MSIFTATTPHPGGAPLTREQLDAIYAQNERDEDFIQYQKEKWGLPTYKPQEGSPEATELQKQIPWVLVVDGAVRDRSLPCLAFAYNVVKGRLTEMNDPSHDCFGEEPLQPIIRGMNLGKDTVIEYIEDGIKHTRKIGIEDIEDIVRPIYWKILHYNYHGITLTETDVQNMIPTELKTVRKRVQLTQLTQL